MNLQTFKRQYNQIPLLARRFFIRAAIVFVVWKLLYIYLLYPAGIPNHFLTDATAWGTAKMVTYTTDKPAFPYYVKNAAYVYNLDRKAFLIGNSCNALEVFVLYIGFIVCLPGYKIKRVLKYVIGGIVAIYVLNILRCWGLFLLLMHNSSIFGFAHKYIFKFILYALVFFMWWRYTRIKPQLNETS